MSFGTVTSGRMHSSRVNEISSSSKQVSENPVVGSASFVYEKTDLVKLNSEGIVEAANYINKRLISETYTPWSWRDNPLHFCPPECYSPADPRTRATLDWIFLVSSLNFSFWSEFEDENERYGIEWRTGWGKEGRKVWTGYWSLLAAINKALEAGIPITDPSFYSSEERCPDSVIIDVFKPAPKCKEGIPLLRERIKIMRENGGILCERFGGSFQGFLNDFMKKRHGHGSSLQLVEMITDVFPSFRDEVKFQGRTVVFLKRAQIMVAETWAAFHPMPQASAPGVQVKELDAHPFFPAGVGQLTMFADYRVPQILHHLCMLDYPPVLVQLLESHASVAHGSLEEISTRAASILAVEEIRKEIAKMREGRGEEVNSVVIDFYLWDLAKRIESGEDSVEGIRTRPMLPAHRTRSVWY